ncbi:hypothetical protein [Latilactobacillus sakei]|uniref:hypothetical protein n=1 Tax=Latilactobacillus sakei TaxID=1599 RepID=UPI00202FBDE8|nr:hypothetical protein [Latilactobacillus sakei]MCM1635828.1 hypothetical protein [Latilactobacillus sakei]
MLSQVLEGTKSVVSNVRTNFFVTETTGGSSNGSGSGFVNQIKGMSGGSNELFANKIYGFVPMLQGVGVALFIIFMILLGIKMGVSAVTSDSRGQAETMKGFGFIVLGLMVLINAAPLVGSFIS